MGSRKKKDLSKPVRGVHSPEQIEEPLADLRRHVRPDEEAMKAAPVGHMGQLAVLVMTDQKVLWRFAQPAGGCCRSTSTTSGRS